MNIFKKHYIENLSQGIRKVLNATTPVDIPSQIDLLNGKLSYTDDIEFNADAKIIKKSDSSFEISLNSANSTIERDNFTLAHELGHLFLHMGYLIDTEKWKSINDYTDSVYYRYGYNEEEYEANEFAANFLMPRDEFLDVVIKNSSDKNKCDFHKVADYFKVSYKVVINRSKWLGLLSWDMDA